MMRTKTFGGAALAALVSLPYLVSHEDLVTRDFLQEQLQSVYRIDTTVLDPSGVDRGATGTGVAFNMEKNEDGTYTVYILTAKHIVSTVVELQTGTIKVQQMSAAPGDASDDPSAEWDAGIVTWHPKLDLAVIAILTAEEPVISDLAAEAPIVADEIYAIGMPLGKGALITDGFVGHLVTSPLNANVLGHWAVSAPIIFGNSGGGVFRKSDGKLIGISVKIATMGFMGGPVPHFHLMIATDTIRPWLVEKGLL
ncbi:MAG: S1 family peptidase [Candidatus Thorarchaeota archaeon]|jgi:S1-C subfamily serine protease